MLDKLKLNVIFSFFIYPINNGISIMLTVHKINEIVITKIIVFLFSLKNSIKFSFNLRIYLILF